MSWHRWRPPSGSCLAALVGFGALAQEPAPAVDPLLATLTEVQRRWQDRDGAWAMLDAALTKAGDSVSVAAAAALYGLVQGANDVPWAVAEAPQVRAVWRRLAENPQLAKETRALAFLYGAEVEYRMGQEPEAVRLWQSAMQTGPWLRFHVQGRLYYACQDRRDTVQASLALAAARQSLPSDQVSLLRLRTMECHCALRMGLFADAYRSLAAADALRAVPGVAPSDIENLAVVEIDLASESGDYAEGVRLARELLAHSISEESRYRADLGLAIGLGRVGDPSQRAAAIAALESLYAEAVPCNRPFIAYELTDLCLLANEGERAAGLAAMLRAGRRLADMPAPHRISAIAGELGRGLEQVSPAQREEYAKVLEATWSEVMQQWRATPIDGAGVAFLQQKFRRNLLSLWFRLQLSAEGPPAASACLARYLEADGLGSAARRGEYAVPSVEQVMGLVPRDGLLLVYLPAEFGSFVFLVTREDVALQALPSSADFEAMVGELRRDIMDAGREQVAALRGRLAGCAAFLLPERVAQRVVDARYLSIAGRELCGAMPFEVLPWPAVDAPWLGLAKAIGYVPSLSVVAHLADRGATVGAAVHAGVGLRLLMATDLAAVDQRQWRSEPLRLGRSVLEGSIASVLPTQVQVVQPAHRGDLARPQPRAQFAAVVAHGIQDGERTRHNGLLLQADEATGTGAIWPEDIEAAGAPGDLVLLGVCGAAAGAVKRGEDGSHHLGGAMLQAGASGVILSDQRVLLDNVFVVLRCVTEALTQGASPMEGLRRARCALWQAHGTLADLAAFRYEGLPDLALRLPPAPIPATRWPGLGWIVAPLLLLAAVCWGRARRSSRARRPRRTT